MFLLIVLLLPIVFSTPHKYPLNQYFKTLELTNFNIEDGSKLYLASIDDVKYLKNIILSAEFWNITLTDLLESEKDGSAKGFELGYYLSIWTENEDEVTEKLTGYFYITSADQERDPAFKVFINRNTQQISRMEKYSTTVILNVGCQEQNVVNSPMTSLVTDIAQSEDTTLKITIGYPAKNYKTDYGTMVFQNPIEITIPDDDTREEESITKFFKTIEPLQINTDIWYFTSTGPISMTVSNTVKDMSDYTTTDVDTTGMITNEHSFVHAVVRFKMTPWKERISGSTFITYINYNTVKHFHNSAATQTNIDVLKATDVTREKLTVLNVTATNKTPEKFYMQYFAFETEPPKEPKPTQPSTVTSSITAEVTTDTTIPFKFLSNTTIIIAIIFIIVFISSSIGLSCFILKRIKRRTIEVNANNDPHYDEIPYRNASAKYYDLN